MKKMLIFITTLTMAFLMLCTVCAAAPQESNSNNINNNINISNDASKNKAAILLMGSNDFISTHYFTMIKEQFSKNNPHAEQLALGSDIQGKYFEYRLAKEFTGEQQPSEEDLPALSAYLEADKVLVMIVKDPVVEKHNTFTLTASDEKYSATIQIDALLVDNKQIIKKQTISNKDDSFYDELRAKRGAFQKCLKELSAVMLPLF